MNYPDMRRELTASIRSVLQLLNDRFFSYTFEDGFFGFFILIAYKVCNGLVEKLSTSAEPKQLNDNENGSTRDVPTQIYGATPNCMLI